MSASAIIFDLDGTLVDSLADIAAAMNHALAERGLATPGLDAYRRMIGEGVRILARRVAPRLAADAAAIDDLLAAYQRRYAERMLDGSRAYPGVPEALDALAARGVPMAVLSNKPDEPTRRMCDAIFGATRFVAVHGARDGVPRKPDPQAALALAAQLGVPPAEVAFVGDTAIDMRTARAAGMRAVGVAWGFRPEELSAAGAERVLARAEELDTV